MPDEPNLQQQQTPPQDPLMNNDPAARNPDGSLKDQQTPPQNSDPKKDEPKVDPPKDEPKKNEPKKDDKPVLTGAPEKYEPFTAPEGYELSEEIVGKASELFKKANLSQEGAQAFIDMYNTELVKAAEAPYEAYVETRKQWRQELATDKTLGDGKDDLRPEVKAAFHNMITSLPTELQTPFKEAMILTGAGDNPAFNRAFFHIAKVFAEGKPVKAGGPASPDSQQKTGAQTMYPNLPSENSPRAG